MILWKEGKPLVWDVTCPDTLALSYRAQATSSAGAVADLAEGRRVDKYSSLGVGYYFTPIAIETFGAMGKSSLSFLKELRHRVRQCTGEAKAKPFVFRWQCSERTLFRCCGQWGTSKDWKTCFNFLLMFLFWFCSMFIVITFFFTCIERRF